MEPPSELHAFFPGTLHVLQANYVPASAKKPHKLFIRFHNKKAYGIQGEIAQSAMIGGLFQLARQNNIQLHIEPKEGELGVSHEYIKEFKRLAKEHSFKITTESQKRTAVYEDPEPRRRAEREAREAREKEEQKAQLQRKEEKLRATFQPRLEQAQAAEVAEKDLLLVRGPRSILQVVVSKNDAGQTVWTLKHYDGARLKTNADLENVFELASNAGVAIVNMRKPELVPGKPGIHAEDTEKFLELAKKHATIGKREDYTLAVTAHLPQGRKPERMEKPDNALVWIGANLLRFAEGGKNAKGQPIWMFKAENGFCKPPSMDESNMDTFLIKAKSSGGEIHLTTKHPDILRDFKRFAATHDARIEETNSGAIAHLPKSAEKPRGIVPGSGWQIR